MAKDQSDQCRRGLNLSQKGSRIPTAHLREPYHNRVFDFFSSDIGLAKRGKIVIFTSFPIKRSLAVLGTPFKLASAQYLRAFADA